MGNKSAKSHAQDEFIKEEANDFKKLCEDILKIRKIFSNEKYLKMIGFKLDIKIYYTPLPQCGGNKKSPNKIKKILHSKFGVGGV